MSFSVEHARQMFAERGPVGFVKSIRGLLGLENAEGVRNRNADGQPVLESQMLSPDAFSLKGLAVALFDGEHNIERQLDLSGRAGFEGNVLEAGNDMVPSQFGNISAYNETVSGLLEAKMLAAYNRPEFIAPQVTTLIPSNKSQEKAIGISTPADAAQERKPGQPHPRAELSERFVKYPVTKNRSNAVDVTREAVMFDLTRQLLEHAEKVAQTLALRKEYLVMDTILGITNDYNYGNTTYYTYVASGGYWTNVVNNDFLDWTALDTNYVMFSKMTDQETGQPISVEARDLLVMPGRQAIANKILTDQQVRQGSSANTTTVTAPIGYGKNPISSNWNAPLVSPYAFKRVIDAASAGAPSDGLIERINTQNSYSWSASQKAAYANTIWLAGNFKKAFAYIENMPLTIVRAAPTSYEMADRGLVFSLFADEMGIPGVTDPRYVIRNQGFAATTANW